jgi:hypothetical protein
MTAPVDMRRRRVAVKSHASWRFRGHRRDREAMTLRYFVWATPRSRASSRPHGRVDRRRRPPHIRVVTGFDRSELHRRPVVTSVAALVLALSFTASAFSDAFGLHTCAHHDALPAVPAGDHHGATGAGSAGHGGAPATARSDHHSPDEPCTCMGACDTSAGIAHPSLRAGTQEQPAIALAVAARQPVTGRRRLSPYLLPWATAPPRPA